jgi:hypothetical protein
MDQRWLCKQASFLGNYRVVLLLGEGAFGEVYLVENPAIGTASTRNAVAIGGARHWY